MYKNKLKKKKRKIRNTQTIVFFWMPVASWCSTCFCCSVCFVCLFVYGPFCHGAFKLDMSTLFTTFFL